MMQSPYRASRCQATAADQAALEGRSAGRIDMHVRQAPVRTQRRDRACTKRHELLIQKSHDNAPPVSSADAPLHFERLELQ